MRAKFYRRKPVMIVNDVPVKAEVEAKERFSAASNLNLLTTLRTGRINPHNTSSVPGFKGIIATDIWPTYLDYSYFGEPDIEKNFDFKKELKKKKDLKLISPREEGEEEQYFVEKDLDYLTLKAIPKSTFYKLEHQKDVYISFRLKEQLDKLVQEIKEVEPKLIIITGKWGFFFLTGLVPLSKTLGNTKDRKPLGGLSTYRTSIERLHESFDIEHNCIIVGVYHPLQAIGMPDKVPFIELDYQKVGSIYQKICEHGVEYYDKKETKSILGTSKEIVLDYLDGILKELEEKPTLVSFDIETMYSATIDCIGVTTKTTEGLCIPFSKADEANMWSLEDETEIMVKLREVMLHPNCQHVGQNYSYENQFYYKLWGLDVQATYDSLILSHVLYNYMQKDLAFLASLYSENYVYWKDEIAPSVENPEQRWEYNIKDITYTLEVTKVLLDIIYSEDESLMEFYKFQQLEVAPALNQIMQRGVKIDKEKKEKFYKFFSTLLIESEKKIKEAIGEPDFNVNSVQQKVKLFKDLLGIKLSKSKKSGNDTTDSAAMKSYIENYPLYKPFLLLILEYQSLKVFVNTFLGMELDKDNRARTQYKIAGTDTYRLSSTKNVWGKGCNFQNIPSKGKIDLEITEQVARESKNPLIQTELKEIGMSLPNVKQMFLPDSPEHMFFNVDFSSADARIVGHLTNCAFYIDIFKEGLDIYSVLAEHYYGHPIDKKSKQRQVFKMVTHACLTGEHEVLTKGGWVKIKEVAANLEIAVWDKDTSNIHFEVPKGYYKDFVTKEEPLYEIKGTSFHQICTLDHKFPYINDNSGNTRVKEAVNLPKSAKLPYSGMYKGGNTLYKADYVRLIVALQADGNIQHIAKNGDVTFRFKFVKQRKVDRLCKILNSLNVSYKQWKVKEKGAINERVCISFKNVLTREMKHFGWWILQFSTENLKVFIDELAYWDGHKDKTNHITISTTSKLNAEIIQTVAHLVGKGSKLNYKDDTRKSNRKRLYTVSINNRNYYSTRNGVKNFIRHDGTKVYCPFTSTGFFMVRHKGHIMVTGNTAYGGFSPTIARGTGLLVHEVDKLQKWYFSVCPQVKAWHRNVHRQISTIGYITNIFGARGWFLNTNDPTLLNKAIAWQPQSEVGILTNKGLVDIEKNEKGKIQVLLQTHDSVSGQYLKSDTLAKERIVQHMTRTLPYKVPLTIPVDTEVSDKSYGDCK